MDKYLTYKWLWAFAVIFHCHGYYRTCNNLKVKGRPILKRNGRHADYSLSSIGAVYGCQNGNNFNASNIGQAFF